MINETTAQRLDRLRSEIAVTIAAYRPRGEEGETRIPGLAVGHIVQPMPPRAYTYEPSLCVCVRGIKQVVFGEQRFAYDEERFLLTSIGLPTIIEVPGASAERPYTALQISLDLEAARRMITTLDTGAIEKIAYEPGFGIAPLSPGLLDAVARLVALLEVPRDVTILADLIHKEILYHLLTGPAAANLRQIVKMGTQSHRVADALAWLRANYASPCRIEELARLCGMGVSTLHRHFRELTTMSPMQYQKHLRLHEARRLMLSEDVEARTAAFRVGYESATQFSREYRRLFGDAPRRDITTIRRNIPGSTAS